MDDLKLFAKYQGHMDSLVKTVQIVSNDIGMQLGLNKCGVLVLTKGKVVNLTRNALPNRQKMKDIDENRYKYLNIVEMDENKEKAYDSQVNKKGGVSRK